MSNIFPEPIKKLPEIEIDLDGLKTHLIQAKDCQIVFMEFTKQVDIPEHFHESQWEIVLEGKVDLYLNGSMKTYSKGDRFFIPKDVKHSAKVYAGYASIAYFNQKDRYKIKK